MLKYEIKCRAKLPNDPAYSRSMIYRRHNQDHRIDGPARIYELGNTYYFRYDRLYVKI